MPWTPPCKGILGFAPSQRGQPSPRAQQHREQAGQGQEPKGGRRCSHLEILVQNPACGWEGPVRLLLPHDPALGGCQLPGVNAEEASGLGEGLQDKGCEPETRPKGLGAAEQGLWDAPESP